MTNILRVQRDEANAQLINDERYVDGVHEFTAGIRTIIIHDGWTGKMASDDSGRLMIFQYRSNAAYVAEVMTKLNNLEYTMRRINDRNLGIHTNVDHMLTTDRNGNTYPL